MTTIGAVLIGSYSVQAQLGKPNLSGQQKSLQKLYTKKKGCQISATLFTLCVSVFSPVSKSNQTS